MKLKASTSIAALAIALGSTSASAFPLPPGSGTTAGAQIEDDNIDFFVDNNANGLLDIGDDLVAPLELTQVIDIFPGNGTAPPYPFNQAADELVALSRIRVIAPTAADAPFPNRIRFGSIPGVPMVALYSLGSAIDLVVSTCGSQAACTAAVVDGTPWMEWDILEGDDEWFFDPLIAGANNPLAVSLLPQIVKVGIANFALSVVPGSTTVNYMQQAIGFACNPALFVCAGDGLVDVLGSADILGGLGLGYNPADPSAAAFAASDADAALNVPEPITLGMLGLGLLGFGASRRKARKA